MVPNSILKKTPYQVLENEGEKFHPSGPKQTGRLEGFMTPLNKIVPKTLSTGDLNYLHFSTTSSNSPHIHKMSGKKICEYIDN